jgi:hypothetical protein
MFVTLPRNFGAAALADAEQRAEYVYDCLRYQGSPEAPVDCVFVGNLDAEEGITS